MLDESADVYAFGVSGVNFAQQVGMIRYIEDEFNPDIYCILVDHYPPENSLLCNSPYRFYVEENSTGYSLKPPKQVFHQNQYGRLIFRTATGRYLKLNRQFLLGDLQDQPNEQEGDIEKTDETHGGLSEHDFAITSFLIDTLVAIVPDDEIIFFSDARKSAIYSGEVNIQPVENFLLLETIQQDRSYYILVDLTPAFIRDYKKNGIRFEASSEDRHWNEHAHSIVAKSLFEIIESFTIIPIE